VKVLLDTCVWGGTLRILEAAGHDVVWTGNRDKDPGDEEILSIAHREGRVLVTLDKDFGELAILKVAFWSRLIRILANWLFCSNSLIQASFALSACLRKNKARFVSKSLLDMRPT